jgi:hypothetical protein
LRHKRQKNKNPKRQEGNAQDYTEHTELTLVSRAMSERVNYSGGPHVSTE